MLAEKFLSNITDIVISDSEKVTKYLVDRQRIDSKKITTVLNGIDIEKFKKEVNIKIKKRDSFPQRLLRVNHNLVVYK